MRAHERVINYGTTKNINIQVGDIEKKIIESKSKIVLLPDDPIKRFWNILVIILLLYVASYVPYSICFKYTTNDSTTFAEGLDMCVDFLFFIDIIINFISSYEDPMTNLPVISLKKIAINYLTGWFFVDFLSVFPVQLIESAFSNGQSLKLARLARLPRLYRLVRILRMIKMLRVFRKSSQFKEWISNLNISVGMIRMLNVLSFQLFMIHLMACFWFLFATLEDNIYETWVGARGIVDEENNY